MDVINDKTQSDQDSTTIGGSLISMGDVECEIEATEENIEWIGETLPQPIEAD
jgi:hypothetical protein